MPKPPQRQDTGVVVDPLSGSLNQRRWHDPTGEGANSLRKGWEYTGVGAGFAFVCWGIWAVSNRGTLTTPVLAFILVLGVAAGVFGMVRLLGRLILVQRFGRVRRSARGAHAATGLFLAAAGLAYLKQTPWVIDLFTWLRGLV